MSSLVVVLGPTATGKTNLAVKIASKYNGEIISADSRQIYKDMNIGTGKDLCEYKLNNKTIPYHLIDILEPNNNYSVFQFKNDFFNIYNSLIIKNVIPVLCGGTGLYIESILLNYQMSSVPPNYLLRKQLESKTIKDLTKQLQLINFKLYDENYHITKRRLIRSIEIMQSKKMINDKNINCNIDSPLVFGLNMDRKQLLVNIQARLEKRLQEGMIDEVQSLINKGIDLNRLKYFGLEYKFVGKYLYDEIKYDEMVEKLNYAINKFSKRQMTFFRRMEKRGINIVWVAPDNFDLINKYMKKYLNHEL